jgi:hypothetical protein
MAKISFDGWDSMFYPHPFETEVNCLVTVNHQLTLKAIDQREKEEIAELGDEDLAEDPYDVISRRESIQEFYERLRVASNNLAAVALVTLVQHWIGKFAEKISGTQSQMITDMKALNKHFGSGPVAVEFFDELKNVRDVNSEKLPVVVAASFASQASINRDAPCLTFLHANFVSDFV